VAASDCGRLLGQADIIQADRARSSCEGDISTANANDLTHPSGSAPCTALVPDYRFSSPVQFTMTVIAGLSASSSKFAKRNRRLSGLRSK
jgi:hypothetical protein